MNGNLYRFPFFSYIVYRGGCFGVGKREEISKLVSVIKKYKEKKEKKYRDYIYDEDVKKENMEGRNYNILRKGDIITLCPRVDRFESEEGLFGMSVSLKGDMSMARELWEVRAVNSLHLKLKRLTNYSNIFEGTVNTVLVLKNNYNFSFANDFLEKQDLIERFGIDSR